MSAIDSLPACCKISHRPTFRLEVGPHRLCQDIVNFEVESFRLLQTPFQKLKKETRSGWNRFVVQLFYDYLFSLIKEILFVLYCFSVFLHF